MNLYEAQEFFSKMYPGKLITFEFDEKCHRFHEIVYTDGNPNPFHHIESHCVKMTIEGMPPQYVPIAPHRETCSWTGMKAMINGKSDVHIQDENLKIIANAPENEKEACLQQWVNYTGLTREQILAKVAALKA